MALTSNDLAAASAALQILYNLGVSAKTVIDILGSPTEPTEDDVRAALADADQAIQDARG